MSLPIFNLIPGKYYYIFANGEKWIVRIKVVKRISGEITDSGADKVHIYEYMSINEAYFFIGEEDSPIELEERDIKELREATEEEIRWLNWCAKIGEWCEMEDVEGSETYDIY